MRRFANHPASFRLRVATALLLAALLPALAATPAPAADVTIKARTVHYDIRGRTAQDVWRQLHLYSIRYVNKKGHVLAQCVHSIAPNADAVRTSKGWLWTNVRATLDITYQYPNWVSVNYAPPEIRAMWDKALDLFVRHEEGHATIALRNANLLVQRLRAIPPQPSFEALKAQAEGLMQAVMERDIREQDLYDRHCTDNDSLRSFFQQAGADTTSLD